MRKTMRSSASGFLHDLIAGFLRPVFEQATEEVTRQFAGPRRKPVRKKVVRRKKPVRKFKRRSVSGLPRTPVPVPPALPPKVVEKSLLTVLPPPPVPQVPVVNKPPPLAPKKQPAPPAEAPPVFSETSLPPPPAPRRPRKKAQSGPEVVSHHRTHTITLEELRRWYWYDRDAAEDNGWVEEMRPKNRDQCRGGVRPCPFVSCRYHLYLDVKSRGAIILNFPGREVWELEETCALDLADQGGMTLEEVASFFELTRERIRQIEEKVSGRLGGRTKAVYRDFRSDWDGDRDELDPYSPVF